ncbi:hypothetical protein CFP65_5578 [Kitasatospora sp. MMS16-BH015]|nr:hypothetical protein CFP65_5578 [Kitasatospora sp. MMS16-BH015]
MPGTGHRPSHLREPTDHRTTIRKDTTMNAVIALQSLEESAQGTELLPITGLGSAFSYYSRCSTTCG